MINDISRAFFEAMASRLVCCELPEGYPGNEDGDMVGVLNKSLYGTRDAAHNWVEEVARFMKKAGFERGRYNPCIYKHRSRELELMVHGDDFVSVGEKADLDWFRAELGKRFKVKTAKVGTCGDQVSEARVLNRILRVTEKGW
eukprot:5156352-Karenia_brevis.AAC.1